MRFHISFSRPCELSLGEGLQVDSRSCHLRFPILWRWTRSLGTQRYEISTAFLPAFSAALASTLHHARDCWTWWWRSELQSLLQPLKSDSLDWWAGRWAGELAGWAGRESMVAANPDNLNPIPGSHTGKERTDSQELC